MDDLVTTVALATESQGRENNSPVQVTLHPPEVWRRLRLHTHEMIVLGASGTGRKIWPRLRVRISGLNLLSTYWIALALQPITNVVWSYNNGEWSARENPRVPSLSDPIVYMHPSSPMKGDNWTGQVIGFEEVRLKCDDSQSGNVKVCLKHKYIPHILIFEGSPPTWKCSQFPLSDAEFIAVDRYYNSMMPSLKIDRTVKKPRATLEALGRSHYTSQVSKYSSSPAPSSPGFTHHQLSYASNSQDDRLKHLLSPISLSSSTPHSITDEIGPDESPFYPRPQMTPLRTEVLSPTAYINVWQEQVAKEYPLPMTPMEPVDLYNYPKDIDTSFEDPISQVTSFYPQPCVGPPPLIPITKEIFTPPPSIQNHNTNHPPPWNTSEPRSAFKQEVRSSCMYDATCSDQNIEKKPFVLTASPHHHPYPYGDSLGKHKVTEAEYVQPVRHPNTFVQQNTTQTMNDTSLPQILPRNTYFQDSLRSVPQVASGDTNAYFGNAHSIHEGIQDDLGTAHVMFRTSQTAHGFNQAAYGTAQAISGNTETKYRSVVQETYVNPEVTPARNNSRSYFHPVPTNYSCQNRSVKQQPGPVGVEPYSCYTGLKNSSPPNALSFQTSDANWRSANPAIKNETL